MEDRSQSKVDMSLDEIIKLNKKENRLAKKTKAINEGRDKGRRQRQGRGRGQLGRLGGGMRGKLTGRGRGQRGRFTGRSQGREKLNAASPIQATTNMSMRGLNRATNQRKGRGQGRGQGIIKKKQMAVSPLSRSTFQNIKNLRGIGRGRGNLSANKRKQLVFTNSGKKQLSQQRTQQLMTVKAQANLLREKEAALKNLQQAKMKMQNINKAIQQSSRDNLVNQRRGLNTNGLQIAVQGRGRGGGGRGGKGRGRGKLLAGLMNKNSVPNLSPTSNRQLVNTSVTISNPTAGRRNKRQWRAKKSDVVVHVDNRLSSAPAKKSSLLDKLNNLKPTVPTTYKFQKNMFAVPSTNISLNDRFSSQSSGDALPLPDGRKVFL